MNVFKTGAAIAAMAVTLTASAQRIKLIEGDLSPLKNERNIAVEFAYDNQKVGKYDQEKDYVSHKKEELNKKEPGRGDTWEKAWISDRETRFEPKFNELFEKSSEMTTGGKNAKYTLVFKTTFTEPGFNIGIMRKNAEINADVLIVETANKSNVIGKISVQKALGRTFGGYDFDTGERISECYADAGKALGKFVKNNL